jgi:hypothetical protein
MCRVHRWGMCRRLGPLEREVGLSRGRLWAGIALALVITLEAETGRSINKGPPRPPPAMTWRCAARAVLGRR